MLHEGTVFPVREKNIPLNIRNTNDPDHPGTLIMESFDDVDDGRLITGIAGKKNYSIVTIAKTGMSSSVGTFRQVFEVFERHGVSIEYAPSGIDCLSLVVPSEKVAPCLYSILGELEKQLQPGQSARDGEHLHRRGRRPEDGVPPRHVGPHLRRPRRARHQHPHDLAGAG